MAQGVTVTINGQEYTLNSSDGTTYSATLTAPSTSSFNLAGGHYPVMVKVTDSAGNITTADDTHATFGEQLKLYVQEKNKPTITDISPASGANIITSNPTFKFTLLDNASQTSGYSGIDLSSLKLTIGGTTVDVSKVTTKAIDGGYECTYTPDTAIADGNCTVTITVSDNDGNISDTATTTFKIDTIPPTLNVTSPSDGAYVNTEKITVSGITSDATSSPVSISIKVGSVDQGAVTVDSDGAFSKEITLADGVNTITIVATDSAGKTSTITRSVTLKTTAPVIKSVEIAPNPVDAGKTFTITVVIE